MNFVSLKYILFLLLVFLLYWNVPIRHRWKILLFSSAFFYMSWNPKYILLLLFVAISSYYCARLIERCVIYNIRKLILIVSISCSLSILFFFKYLNFGVSIVSSIINSAGFSSNFDAFDIILPVGISFYTFQSIAYVIDVYRGEVEAEDNLGLFLTYIMFFPQLVAGPIERSKNLLPQIKKENDFDYGLAVTGMKTLVYGYFKKAVVADNLSVFVDKVYSDVYGYTGFAFLVTAFFFTIQIYCDFSGYTDIARGTANLFGIKLIDNFNFPYSSHSLKEFWNRWHMSLNAWFRDYVYIPLGGNRCGSLKRRFNIMVVFLLSGLWHGAAWNFVAWGGTTV